MVTLIVLCSEIYSFWLAAYNCIPTLPVFQLYTCVNVNQSKNLVGTIIGACTNRIES